MRGLSPIAASGGHSSSRCAGLSLSRPLLLRSTSSRRAGSVIVAHGPSCSAACGILPDQGSNPCPPHWQADPQPLRHQGSPCYLILIRVCCARAHCCRELTMANIWGRIASNRAILSTVPVILVWECSILPSSLGRTHFLFYGFGMDCVFRNPGLTFGTLLPWISSEWKTQPHSMSVGNICASFLK